MIKLVIQTNRQPSEDTFHAFLAAGKMQDILRTLSSALHDSSVESFTGEIDDKLCMPGHFQSDEIINLTVTTHNYVT